MKNIISAVSVLMALAVTAEPVINNVVVRQQWPWSTDIRIDYTLSGAEDPVDVNLEFKDGEEDLSVASGVAAISGDVYYVGNGLHTITIDPVAAFGTAKPTLNDFKVRLSPTTASALPDNKVLYKIFDLENGNVTDVTRSELLLGKYGSVETDYSKVGNEFYTPLTDVIVWTGVTNNPAYKTTKLVLRRIPAGSFKMGSPENETFRDKSPTSATKVKETQHSVTLTKDFWIGVFPVTRKQYTLITGSETIPMSQHGDITYGNAEHNPVYDLMYSDIRGSYYGAKWPENNSVDSTSVLGAFRAIFDGKIAFDLPTEAQWEYACRGGNEGVNVLYSGKLLYPVGSTKPIGNNRNEICWNYYNSLGSDKPTKTQAVGGKLPNAYGLYDMIGNVYEWVLDWAADFTSDPVENPKGPTSGTDRVVRGGDVTIHSGTHALRSAFRFGRSPSHLYDAVIPGFRVCVTEE
jgi:formylglycine-generating enzyme required for sulfatase activity